MNKKNITRPAFLFFLAAAIVFCNASLLKAQALTKYTNEIFLIKGEMETVKADLFGVSTAELYEEKTIGQCVFTPLV